MKNLLYFLILATTNIAISHQTMLDVKFFYKEFIKDQASGLPIHKNSRTIQVDSIFLTKENNLKLECVKDSNFILKFNIQEQNENEVKIETEILDNTELIAKPVLIIPYNQKGEIKLGETIKLNSRFFELSLSIVPSKVDSYSRIFMSWIAILKYLMRKA